MEREFSRLVQDERCPLARRNNPGVEGRSVIGSRRVVVSIIVDDRHDRILGYGQRLRSEGIGCSGRGASRDRDGLFGWFNRWAR